MNASHDPPVTADTLINFAQAGRLSPAALQRALTLIGVIPSAEKWQTFVWRLLLFLGAGFTVVGIFFFFAYNWDSLPRIAKLGIVEGLIVLTIIVAWWQRLNLVGRVSLTAASLFVGALLAIYGQQYQIQANAWQLFALWTGLIMGWVVIGTFAPLWFIWQLLLNLSVILYWQQAVDGDIDILLGILFGINITAMLVWEWAYGRYDGLNTRWWLRVSGLFALLAVFIPTNAWISIRFSMELINETPLLVFGIIAWVVTTLAIVILYRRGSRDLPLVTIALLLAIIVGANTVLAVTGRANRFYFDSAFALLLTGLAVIGMGALAVRYLRDTPQEVNDDAHA